MIQYMPFTYINDVQIQTLTSLLGPIGICQTTDQLVPEPMRRSSGKGTIVLQFPQGVDGERLTQAISNYKAWAQLHAGHPGHMAGLALGANGRPPLVDETDVTQISARIRAYGRTTEDAGHDPVMQAALFVAICQEHDQQQEALALNLASVHSMENELFAQLTGNGADARQAMGAGRSGAERFAAQRIEMVAQRIRTWAVLARQIVPPADGYITTSQEVFDTLLEWFPQAVLVGPWEIPGDDRGHPAQAVLGEMAAASDPLKLAARIATGFSATGASAIRLHLLVLTGCRPEQMLARLCWSSGGNAGTGSTAVGPPNTLVGVVQPSFDVE